METAMSGSPKDPKDADGPALRAWETIFGESMHRDRPLPRELASLLELATDGLYLTDGSGRLLAANRLFAQMIGADPKSLPPFPTLGPTSGSDRDVSPLSISDWNGQLRPEEIEAHLSKNLSLPPGETRVFETLHKRRDGSLFPVEISVRKTETAEGPVLLHFVRDITRRHEAVSTLDRLGRYDAIRREATHQAFSATSIPEFCENLCRICTREEREVLLAFVCRPNGQGVFEFVASAGRTGFLDGSRILLDPSLPQGQGPTGTCYREGRPLFNAPLGDVSWEAPWKERAIRFGLRSLSTLPIIVDGRPWGVLALGHGDPEPVDPPLAQLLTELAETVSRGIDRLDTLQKSKEHAALIDVLIDNTDTGILLLEGRKILMANGTLLGMLDYESPSDLQGLPAEAIFSKPLAEAEGREPRSPSDLSDFPVKRRDGSLLLCDLSRRTLPNGKLSTSSDGPTQPLEVVTLRDSRLRHQTVRHIQRVSHFRSLLAKAAETMAEASDEQELFERICRLAVEHAQIPLAWIGRPGPDGIFRFLARWGKTGYLDGLTLSIDPQTPSGMASSARTFREGQTIVQPSFVGPLAPWRAHAARYGLAASITLPIRRGGRVDAVLTAYHNEEEAFDPELREILEELAKNLSRGLDRLDVVRDRQRISAQNEAILGSPAIGILLVSDGVIRQANPRMGELLGEPTPEKLTGAALGDFFDEEGVRTIQAASQLILQGEAVDTVELRGPDRGGTRWIALSGVPFPGEGGGILWTASDITLKRLAQENQRLFANALQSLDEGVVISDPAGSVLYANPAFERLTGYPSFSMVGKNCRLLQGPDTSPETVREIRQALERGQSFRKALLNYRKDGSSFWNLLSLTPLRSADGTVTHYVGIQNDITDLRELKLQNEHLEFVSRHDPLTGLANRTALEEHLERTLSRENRTGTPFAVGMIDLDDFKPVNDTWGHQAGDRLLQEIARRLTGALRHHDLAVRLGGDEFVVVVEDLPGGERSPAFPALLERIHKSLTAPFVLGDGISTRVGISMGVAFFPEDGTTPDTLLRTADTLLGQLKEKKSDRSRWWATVREGLTGERESREEELPFGGEVRRLLDKHSSLIEESIRDFVRDFYKNLPANPEAAEVLSHLSPKERDHLARGQEAYLKQILSPEIGKDSVVSFSRKIGEIHFLTGVSSGLLIEATSLYRRLLAAHLRRSLLFDRERRILLDAADRRIEIHVATEIRTQSDMHSLYLDAALAWGSPGLSTDDGARKILALPGIVGLALTNEGTGEGDAIHAWGELPEGIEEFVGREHSPLPIAPSPWPPPSPAGAFSRGEARGETKIRSALSLYSREGDPLCRLLLFGSHPHQFASRAMQQFSRLLHSRLPLTHQSP